MPQVERTMLRRPNRHLASLVASCAILALSTGCLSVLPSSMKQASDVKAGITNAINEVQEVRNTLTTQVNNVQNDARYWFLGLGVVMLIGAAFPIVLLILVAWLVKKWIARYSYVGQFEEIKAKKGLG